MNKNNICTYISKCFRNEFENKYIRKYNCNVKL